MVCVPAAVTVAVIVRVTAVLLLGTLPTSQTPVPLSYVPWLAVCETYVSPAGSWSVTCTPVATFPRLWSETVKTTFSPAFGVALLTVFVSERSECLTKKMMKA